MRCTARAVGARLRDEVAYRGAFTVDGVLTSEGFLPTELNPRNGAALNMMVNGAELPFQLLLDAVVAGVDADWRPGALEDLLLAHADEHRAGGTGRVVAPRRRSTRTDPHRDRRRERGAVVARVASDDEPAIGTMAVGPNPSGSYVRLTLDPTIVPSGPSVAPLALAFWRFADDELGLGLDAATLTCAPAATASGGRR